MPDSIDVVFTPDLLPFSDLTGNVSDRQIVLTTTNGTRTLQACRAAERVLVGSFLNLSATVNRLAQVEGELVLACSGREGGFCTEDTVFAGACVEALAGTQLTDAAETAKLLYQTHRADLVGDVEELLSRSIPCQHWTGGRSRILRPDGSR